MNPQIVFNFNFATDAEQLAGGLSVSTGAADQGLPAPSSDTATFAAASEASLPTPVDDAAAASVVNDALPAPFALAATEADQASALPTPMDMFSASVSADGKALPTPFDATGGAALATLATTGNGAEPTPFDRQDDVSATVAERQPEPGDLDQMAGDQAQANPLPVPDDFAEADSSDGHAAQKSSGARGKAK